MIWTSCTHKQSSSYHTWWIALSYWRGEEGWSTHWSIYTLLLVTVAAVCTQHRGFAMVRLGTLNTVAWGQGAHTHTHTHAHARTHARTHTHAHARTHARTHTHHYTLYVHAVIYIHVQHTIHRYATLSHKASFVSYLSLQTFKCWDVVFVALYIISIAVFTPRQHHANNWHWRDWVSHTQIESYTQDIHSVTWHTFLSCVIACDTLQQ